MTDDQAKTPAPGDLPKAPDETTEPPLEPADPDDEEPTTTITIDEPTLIVPSDEKETDHG